MDKKIKSISPDPVISAVVELRFEPVCPKIAVYGILYNELKDNFRQQLSLPIMQLPEEVRLNAPNLKFRPWYQLTSEKTLLQIGPDVIAINCDCSSGYMGWTKFYSMIDKINKSVIQSNVVKVITRVGIRFISFFENINIFDKIKLQIHYEEHNLTKNFTTFTTHIQKQNFTQRLVLNNEVLKRLPNSTKKQGSTVDIDTFTGREMTNFNDLENIIDQGHKLEKTLFFSLLKKDFLNSLNPCYEKEGE